MASNQSIFKDEFHFVDSGHDRDRSVSELCRHGIIIAVEADQRQRTRISGNQAMRLELLFRKRLQKVLTLFLQQHNLHRRLASKLTLQICTTAGCQPLV